MFDVAKADAQLELVFKKLTKFGFERVGDTFYAPPCPDTLNPEAPPPWSRKTTHFSKIRAVLFVL